MEITFTRPGKKIVSNTAGNSSPIVRDDHIRMIGRSVDDSSVQNYLQIPLVPPPGCPLPVLVASLSTAELWWDALECGIDNILPGHLVASPLCQLLETRGSS
jgi:hypothetical protein